MRYPDWRVGEVYQEAEICQHCRSGFEKHKFQCIMPHIADKSTEPEAGPKWSNVWEELVDGDNMYPGRECRLEIPGIEPVEIELRTSDNKTCRKTTDRKAAHEAEFEANHHDK